MILHAWTVLCTTIITARENGAPSYITALEKAALPSFPTETPALKIGTCWYTNTPEPIRFDFRALVESPTKKRQKLAERLGIETKDRVRVNVSCSFKAEHPGRYYVIVQFRTDAKKWQTASKTPLDLNTIEEAPIGHTSHEQLSSLES